MVLTIKLSSGKEIELTGDEVVEFLGAIIGNKARDVSKPYPYYPTYPYIPNYPEYPTYPYYYWSASGTEYPDSPLGGKPTVENCGYNGAPLD